MTSLASSLLDVVVRRRKKIFLRDNEQQIGNEAIETTRGMRREMKEAREGPLLGRLFGKPLGSAEQRSR
jgi:hypothetical protein